MYEAKIVLDSISPVGCRLVTVAATYPRIVHAEVLTHRDRERNAASSRAIPYVTMRRNVEADPFVPLVWGGEQSGMQTAGPIPQHLAELAEELWAVHRNFSLEIGELIHNIGKTYNHIFSAPLADYLRGFGVPVDKYRSQAKFYPSPGLTKDVRIHKSLPNRLVEAHQFITVVMTATQWKNFFALRCHHMAEVHFQHIACLIRDAIDASTPRPVKVGDWHLPYVTGYDEEEISLEEVLKGYEKTDPSKPDLTLIDIKKAVSVARCARVSYLTHEGKREIGKDLDLYARLRNPDGPAHASPMGHVAQARHSPHYNSGPFLGWRQHRKEIPNECADTSN